MIMVEPEFQEETSNRFPTQVRLISTRLRQRRGGRQPINSGSVSKAKFSVRRNLHPGMAHIVSRSGQQARPGEKLHISDSKRSCWLNVGQRITRARCHEDILGKLPRTLPTTIPTCQCNLQLPDLLKATYQGTH